jgi:hypothetical protein
VPSVWGMSTETTGAALAGGAAAAAGAQSARQYLALEE